MGRQIRFVTGGDRHYFALILTLLGSFGRQMPGERLWVCDFGLADEQKRFLRELGVLLEAPVGLGRGTHPWICKSSIGSYMGDAEFDALVWLDADMIVVRPLVDHLTYLLEVMQAGQHDAAVAGHLPEESLAQMAAMYRAPQFARHLREFSLPGHLPYVNSGFLLTTSCEVLDDWRGLTKAARGDILFEQHSLNVAVYRRPHGPLVLDPRVWNLNNYPLHRTYRSEGGEVYGDTSLPVNVLHITAQEHTLRPFKLDKFIIEQTVRMTGNKVVDDLIMETLASVANEHAGLLRSSGLIH